MFLFFLFFWFQPFRTCSSIFAKGSTRGGSLRNHVCRTVEPRNYEVVGRRLGKGPQEKSSAVGNDTNNTNNTGSCLGRDWGLLGGTLLPDDSLFL